MQRIMCKSKVCGLRVTHKSIEYEGSIKMPPEVLETADILPGEVVLVVNVDTGVRFNTYVIKGKPGECVLLGGAARLGEAGDKLLVISYGLMDTEDAKMHNPIIIAVNDKNQIKK